MEKFQLTLAIVVLVAGVVGGILVPNAYLLPFKGSYHVSWAADHVKMINETRVELLLDQSSGASFRSNDDYLSGWFAMWIKLPANMAPGVVTTFKVISKSNSEPGNINHDELDIEFIGTNDKPYLKTNVFSNDLGNRVQSFHLWFDPSADFHKYDILWNAHQIVFFVDRNPIRVFKNNTKYGVNYPTGAMHSEISLWNPKWSGKVDWAKGPFRAQFEGFVVAACASSYGPVECARPGWLWNDRWDLTPQERQQYENVKKKFMFYDYCVSKPKKEGGLPSN